MYKLSLPNKFDAVIVAFTLIFTSIPIVPQTPENAYAVTAEEEQTAVSDSSDEISYEETSAPAETPDLKKLNLIEKTEETNLYTVWGDKRRTFTWH